MPAPTGTNYYAVPFPTFQRAMRNIYSITQSYPALLTTTLNGIEPGAHQYATGLIVRLVFPAGTGMVQADGLMAPITVINSTQFTMPIDTTNFDAFVQPVYVQFMPCTPAQTVPTGEVNEILTMATQNVLPYT